MANIDTQIEQAKTRLKNLERKRAAAARKRDTRAKIVLGGSLAKLAREHVEVMDWVERNVLPTLSERDRPLVIELLSK